MRIHCICSFPITFTYDIHMIILFKFSFYCHYFLETLRKSIIK